MSETENRTLHGENMGASGRKRGPRADSDLSGTRTRVEGEKGLETAPRASIVWARLGDFAKRMVGDPIGLIEREELLDPVVLLDNHSRTLDPYLGHKQAVGPITKELNVDLDLALGQPDAVIVNGHRYVHEERVEEANAARRVTVDGPALLPSDTLIIDGLQGLAPDDLELLGQRYVRRERRAPASAMLEIEGLRDDVRSAEKAADDLKDRAFRAAEERNAAESRAAGLERALAVERGKVADLSQPRIFNAVGLIEADLAERYESLRTSFQAVSNERAQMATDLAEARALIAESAPVVRFVEMIAGFVGDELEANCSVELRDAARNTFATPADYDPRTYTDEQREDAIDKLRSMVAPGIARSYPLDRFVDRIAEKLGMRRAS